MDKRIQQLLQFKKEGKFYYSFIIFENRRSSKYPLLLPRSEVIDFLSGWKNDREISQVVKYVFLNHLFNHTELPVIDKFLNFHYDEYPGDKLDFIKRVEEDVVIFFDDLPKPPKEWINNIEPFDDFEINGFKIMDKQRKIVVDPSPYFENYTLQDYHHYEFVNKYFKRWVEQKTNETKPSIRSKKTPQNKALWRGDNDSILEFKELLINYEFIEQIDDNEFTNHFTNKSFKEKINWIDELIVLIRLFDELTFAIDKSYFKGGSKYPSTQELSRHFLFRGEQINSKNLVDARNSKKGEHTKRDEEIKEIRESLKKYFPDINRQS